MLYDHLIKFWELLYAFGGAHQSVDLMYFLVCTSSAFRLLIVFPDMAVVQVRHKCEQPQLYLIQTP